MNKGQRGQFRTRAWLSFPVALLFCGSVLASSWLSELTSPEPGLRLTVLLIPLPLFLLFVLAAFRSFKAYDATQRSLLVEALTFSFILTLFALLGAELLQLARVPVWHNADAWPYLAFIGYIAGYWSAVRRQPR